MDKLKKQILFVLLISILLCSVQAIAAADVSDTGVNDDVFDLSNDIETVQADSNDEVITDEAEETLPDGSFTDLYNDISSSTGTLNLEKNYVYNSTIDSGKPYINPITINKNLIINGNGKTIDGKGIAALFRINGAYTITLNDLTIVNCTAKQSMSSRNYYGAVIDAHSNYGVKLYINDCTFLNNTAHPSSNGYGGVIYVSGSNRAVLNITGSTFKGNKAESGSAIYMDHGILDISDTKLLENRASSTSINIAMLDPEYYPQNTVFHGWIGNFTGEDNLINGIYVDGVTTTFKDVTYLGEDGETTTSTVPKTTEREAGITVNVIIRNIDTGEVQNLSATTNSTGGYLITAAQAHLEEGRYTAYAIHYGDEYYTEKQSKNMDWFWSHMHNTNITNDTVEGYAGDEAEVSFTVIAAVGGAPVQNGTVVFTIGETNYTFDIDPNTGEAKGKIILPEESCNITVTYDGTGTKYYWNSTGNLEITIKEPVDTKITVTTQDIKIGNPETVTFSINPSDVTGTVSVVIKDADGNTVYENEAVDIEDGEFTVPADSLPTNGTYNVTVSFAGNKYYNPSEDSKTFKVSKYDVIVTIDPEPVTGEQGTTATVTITVTDENGDPVTSGTVVYTINWDDKLGETHSITLGATLDENGQATQEVELSGEPGTYSATASYTDDSGKYNDGEADGTATVTESEDDDDDDDDDSTDDSDDSTDDSDDSTDDSDDSTDDSSEETQGTASKSAAVETLATGNPIAMLVLVLLTLVSTISIRRQK